MATPVAKTYDWKQALRTHGLRATPSTLATLQCLEHASQAMSHDDLTQQLGEPGSRSCDPLPNTGAANARPVLSSVIPTRQELSVSL